MRTWRVGSFSMGIALLSLGIILLLSHFFSFDLTFVMTAWWPVLLVVLGIEILLYLFFKRKEKPVLKYDFLSIIFAGIIGMASIGFAALSATGAVEAAAGVFGREERTFDLPEYTVPLAEGVKRVVVDMAAYPLTLESTNGREISFFGTYSAVTKDGKPLLNKAADYLAVYRRGDTLFIKVKQLPASQGPWMDTDAWMEGTLLVPGSVQLEVTGAWHELELNPRKLNTNWRFEQFSDVTVHLAEDSDVQVLAAGVRSLDSNFGQWNILKNQTSGTEDGAQENSALPLNKDNGQDEIYGIYKKGQGTRTIYISNSHTAYVKVR